MDASESALNREEMERRRLAAAQQLLGGQSQAKVARMYGVSRTTTSRWHHALARNGGVEGLRKRRATGRPSRLTPEQLQEVARIHREGPLLQGFSTGRWTTARFAQIIENRFGVHYDEDHVGRLMHKLGLRNRPDNFYHAAFYAPPQSEVQGTSGTP